MQGITFAFAKAGCTSAIESELSLLSVCTAFARPKL
nr:MAG TPA: hypothetical protein [Caudoviricetes sp.]